MARRNEGQGTARSGTAPAKAIPFIDARRRGFLQGAAIAGGTVASGATLAATDGVEPVTANEPEALSAGYRETDHVREYYAKARY